MTLAATVVDWNAIGKVVLYSLIAVVGVSIAFGFATIVALAFVALSCWETRWWLTASGAVICLSLVIVVMWGMRGSPRVRCSSPTVIRTRSFPSTASSGCT